LYIPKRKLTNVYPAGQALPHRRMGIQMLKTLEPSHNISTKFIVQHNGLNHLITMYVVKEPFASCSSLKALLHWRPKGTFYGIKQFLTNLVSDGNKSKPCIAWGLCILFVFTGRHNISSVI